MLTYFLPMFSGYQKFLLHFKEANPEARRLAKSVEAWLQARGKDVVYTCKNEPELILPDNMDCAIVLGGDGTILGLARRLAGKNVPVFGINFGRIGFLTTSDPQNWQNRLEKVLNGNSQIRDCLVLRWQLKRNDRTVANGVAVNDLVISCGSLARLVSLDIAIDGEYMGLLRADGLIMYTPLGSTGYNISAGGPALQPGMSAIGMTPVCPFTVNTAPLVFPASSSFSLSISSQVDCYLTIDGQEGQQLSMGDTVTVTGWQNAVQFVSDNGTFFERLRSRGFILEDHN